MSGNLPSNIVWLHMAIWEQCLKQAVFNQYDPVADRVITINVTEQDKLDLIKYHIERANKIDGKRYLGFICLDSKRLQQSAQLFAWFLPLVEKAGYKTLVAHESDYFCNRGYYYGNVLKMYLIEVIDNV